MNLYQKKRGIYFLVLLGSCKDNKNPYIFFTRKSPLSEIIPNSDIPISGCPLEIYNKSDDIWNIEDYLKLDKCLHIGKVDIVSSQFCELRKRKGKWEIQSENIFNNAIVPLLKALSAEITKDNETFTPNLETEKVEYRIYYPLIVLNGPLLQYHFPLKGIPQLKKQSI